MLVIKEVFTFGVDHACDQGVRFGVDQLMIKTCSFRVDHACDQVVYLWTFEFIMLLIKEVVSFRVDHACGQVMSTALELIMLMIKSANLELIMLVIKKCLALELIMLVIKECIFGDDHACDQREQLWSVDHACDLESAAFELIMLGIKESSNVSLKLIALVIKKFSFGVDHA
ncbi:hypothetical protein TIFTF001_048979 [Ficus carica]|uniref:Uncharacterized protein n=1 Tax=Ficus carica TaxID=3494 RepID=A0AA88CMH5_FICCA|nr:hypothetical protein TIFTF001_048978 [Ficus carica]GMN22301.1 hypothetical protein TIFTF001_048979 [Ficus carica]